MSSRGIPLTAINGGMNRLRVKGAARKDTLYQLTNAYVTAGNTIKPRGGTIRNANLATLATAGSTKGLVAHQGALHVFSAAKVAVPSGYVDHVLSHPAATMANTALSVTYTASSLLHFEDGNGSTSFTDAGFLPAPVWTAHGAGVQESTGLAKFGSGSLTVPSASSGLYVSTPVSAGSALDLHASDFTIEGWFNTGTWNNNQYLWSLDNGTNNTNQWSVTLDATGKLVFIAAAFGSVSTGAAAFTRNVWNHVAVTRYGYATTLWLNGASVGTLAIGPALSALPSTPGFNLGGAPVAGALGFAGNIDEFRVVVGAALYTAAFTPSTVALTAAVNLAGGDVPSLLHFNDGANTFVDSGASPATWAQTGGSGSATESSAQAKFGSGSLFISGNDAEIRTPHVSGGALDITSGDFTVELWVYPTPVTQTNWVNFGQSDPLQISAGNVTLFRIQGTNSGAGQIIMQPFGANGWAASSISSGANTLNINAWNHVVVMRRNDVLILGVNGTLTASSNQLTGNATAIPGGSFVYVGGCDNSGVQGSGWKGGYVDEVQITKGLAKYGGPGTAYTVPAAPAGNVAPYVPIALLDIHFAAPFMGFLYVVAEFVSDGGSGLGTVFHYWLQTSGKWLANTLYQVGQIISPNVDNGLTYRAERFGAPNPAWAASTLKAVSDKVEPTVPNGFLYTATVVDGGNPITGTTEPTWPIVDGGVVYEESEKTGTGEVAAPAPQPTLTTPSPGTGGRYINPYIGIVK